MTRSASVRAFAKINLDLRVLERRPDQFHEIRTVFQTISLADALSFQYTPDSQTVISVEGMPDVADNLVTRATHLVLAETGCAGQVTCVLRKRIPMGGGLGGGSSDAAAALLTLPVLLQVEIPLSRLLALAAQLGSDVPFFLLGGMAVGVGRGEECYPLPDAPPLAGLLATPGIHVSTPDAYRELQRGLTRSQYSSSMSSFQAFVESLERARIGAAWAACENDFEAVVFGKHPRLEAIRQQLTQLGACPARMTGSGSAVFGLFARREEADEARRKLAAESGPFGTIPFTLLSRRQYRATWWRSLRQHLGSASWPPRSRPAQ